LAPKTVKNILGTLSRILHRAEEYGLIARVPAFRPIEEGDRDPDDGGIGFRFLDFDEADLFIQAASRSIHRELIIFLIGCGLRIGEAFALRWTDLNLDSRRVNVQRAVYEGEEKAPKTNAGRRLVPIPEWVIDALQAQREKGLPGPYVFPRRDGGQQDRKAQLNGLHGICRRAGFDPFGWHVLRHTFGSHAAMRGVAEDALQKWMGHEDTKMTKRYTHLAKSFLDGEATKLAESPGTVARRIRRTLQSSSAQDGAEQPITDESD
jgi:integrase